MSLYGLASYGMVCSAIMLKNVDSIIWHNAGVIIWQKAGATIWQNAGNIMITYCMVQHKMVWQHYYVEKFRLLYGKLQVL